MQWFSRSKRRRKRFEVHHQDKPQLFFTEASLKALEACMRPEIRAREESIVYLLGSVSRDATWVFSVVRPIAQTTRSSFDVSVPEMAKVVRCASELGVQVAGQAHTHPVRAFHSQGDDEGARIAYEGYISLVLPYYGEKLPSLDGAAAYVFNSPQGFVPISSERILVLPTVPK